MIEDSVHAPFQLEEATIAGIHAALASGSITVRTLVEQYLARCDAYDQRGPKLNVLLSRNPAACAEADRLDAEFRRTGRLRPLHGIPVLLKDNVETAGLATTAGSLLLQDHVPRYDAWLVRKLRDAGAIILAKTNLHEFAVWGETVSSLGGQTLNPYDLTRTPGGSSGGSGAGVAANLGVIGIGTDTINSIRSPASANSLVGLRPTFGLVGRSGIIPFSFTQDVAGPLTRTMEDTARVMDVIAGYDPQDRASSAGFRQRPESYVTTLNRDGLRGARLGVLNSFFGGDAVHAETNAVVRAAAEQMREQGATLVALDERFDSQALLLENSLHLHELQRDLDAYLARLPARFPVHGLKELVASGRYHPGIESNLRQGLIASEGVEEYRRRVVLRQALQLQLLKVLADHDLDAILFPHQKRLVVPVGETQVERNGVLAAVTGFPALVVPAGFSRPTASAPLGVPIGLELVARPFAEPLLLSLGYAYEQVAQNRKPPLSAPPLT